LPVELRLLGRLMEVAASTLRRVVAEEEAMASREWRSGAWGKRSRGGEKISPNKQESMAARAEHNPLRHTSLTARKQEAIAPP